MGKRRQTHVESRVPCARIEIPHGEEITFDIDRGGWPVGHVSVSRTGVGWRSPGARKVRELTFEQFAQYCEAHNG